MTRMFKSFVREVWLELLELIEMCKVCFTYPFFFFEDDCLYMFKGGS